MMFATRQMLDDAKRPQDDPVKEPLPRKTGIEKSFLDAHNGQCGVDEHGS
jgi:hypothetical protein